ncbi:MAG: prepilin-type N-terminal cleavage/methylation domain-containing protein [Candidatus Riflebacteria bacterium]|nr:prepilin-type N-terminal cleavage/methylation domain-containing protein [Candidatus Riflebacteria bacterium]
MKKAFSLLEVLVVVMLISAGILPIYSLVKSGQKRIVRADSRTIATLYGASALELARTLGYEKSMTLDNENDFKVLRENAKKNGFEIIFQRTLQPLTNSTKSTKQSFLLRAEIDVRSFNRTFTDSPTLKFVTILTDPRFNFY